MEGRRREGREEGEDCNRAACWVIELQILEGWRRRRVERWDKELEERETSEGGNKKTRWSKSRRGADG